MTNNLTDTRIISYEKLLTPKKLLTDIPITPSVETLVKKTRTVIKNILSKKDRRLLFIVGPCSIHNIKEAKDYARSLKHISDQVQDKIIVVMRVYFEKPRTTIGWKGFINDPDLNETYDVNKGLRLARELLLYINSIGLPCGYEVLDTITPQYICDLISWGAVGARTTESQVHRQMVSGLSMPVGFKNGTGGTITMAVDAAKSASFPHCFMGITDTGNPAIYKTSGNKDCHIILRGGSTGPNYYKKNIKETEKILNDNHVTPNIMVDCSHGNSQKNHENQPLVLDNIVEQILEKRIHHTDTDTPTHTVQQCIIGVMLESNIHAGQQTLDHANPGALKPGVSITDSCLDIKKTEEILWRAYNKL